jgi:hypothetical protein
VTREAAGENVETELAKRLEAAFINFIGMQEEDLRVTREAARENVEAELVQRLEAAIANLR